MKRGTSGARRRWPWIVLAVVVVWGVAAAVQASRAYGQLRAGSDLVAEAREKLGLGAIVDGRAARELRTAERRFAAGERHASGVVLAPVRVLPVLGRQLRSVIALAGAAEVVAGEGADAASEAGELLADPPDGGPERVRLIRQLGELTAATRTRIVDLDLGPNEALLGPLATRRADFEDALAEAIDSLDRASQAASGTADLLAGPSTYLLLAANNAEMRAGSGMFLSAGTLSASNGQLALSEMRATGDLAQPEGAVTIGGDLEARWGWLNPDQDWRNLGVTPRFDVTGDLAARLWEAETGEQVDGVVAVDIAALQAVLAATGAVTVDDRAVDGANVVELLMHDQYAEVAGSYDESQRARRDLLGRIAAATVETLDSGRYDVGPLATGLGEATAGRHLMLWSRHADQQRAWEAAGVAGMVASTDLMAAVLNRAGTKLDYFLDVEARLTTASTAGGVRHVEVRIDLRNETPTGEVPYIAGPYPGSDFAYGEYVGLVALTIPADSGRARFEGIDHFAVAGPDGPTRVIAREVRVLPGESITVTARFELPARMTGLTVLPSARIPSVDWRGPSGAAWTDDAAHRVEWAP